MVSVNQPKRSASRLYSSSHSAHPRPSKARHVTTASRTFEAESLGIHSLQVIAASNPQDDLSDEQVAYGFQRPQHSKELIAQLIDFIKAL